MPFFPRDGINFYYEKSGSGLPLIFCHPLGSSLASVRNLVVGLPGLRVILYDNRGHGKTAEMGDPSRLTFAEMADDVAGLLDHLDIPSAVLGGVSMGAGISLALALKSPGRVKALVLSRPAWLNDPHPPNLRIFGILADLIEQFGRDEALVRFRETAYFLAMSRESPETARSLENAFAGRSELAMITTFRSIPASAPFASMDDLGSLKMPALVLTNRNDPIHPQEYGQRLAGPMPNAVWKDFPSKSESVELHQVHFRTLVSQFLGQQA
jgi:pimeloyl-ACP methyl ester carboxylesterase